MKTILLTILVFISLNCIAQTNTLYPPAFNKFFRLSGKKLQYDSTRNGNWKNLATEGYVQGWVASHESPPFDTTTIYSNIALKLNKSDTTSMLSSYLRKADTTSLSNRIDTKLNKSDSTIGGLYYSQHYLDSIHALLWFVGDVPLVFDAGTPLFDDTTGGVNTIYMTQADSLTDGFLTATDWTHFYQAYLWGNHADQNYLKNITGLVSPGTNATITGTGTAADPYVINSSGAAFAIGSPSGDYTIPSGNYFFKLLDLTTLAADKTVTFPTPSTYTGQQIKIINNNSNGTYHWLVSGTVQDGGGSNITQLTNGTPYTFISDGTAWVKAN